MAMEMEGFDVCDWIPPISGFNSAAEALNNKPTAWSPQFLEDVWEAPIKYSPFIPPDASVHSVIPVNPRPAAHFTEGNLNRTLDQDLARLSADLPKDSQEVTVYHQSAHDLMQNLSWDQESQMQSLIRGEEDAQYWWQTPSLQTNNAMDTDSIMHNGQFQSTVASPDLSSGTCVQLPPACLPANSPLSPAPLQPETPVINNATVAVHTGLPASLLRAAQQPQESPQTVRQELPTLALARPAKGRCQPDARGRASAERSAASGSRSRSRSRSPIRDADIAISDVSGNAASSGGVLLRGSTVEEQTTKRPAKKNACQTKKKSGSAKKSVHQTKKKKSAGKKTGSGGKQGGPRKAKKTSKYLGVSFHSLNLKWRTTVFYKKNPRHMGYHANEEDAARQYDEVAIAAWDEKTEINFPIEDYPAKKDLDAKWLPVLEAKVAAQIERQEEAARRKREKAEAEFIATGGRIRKTPAKIPKKRRQKKPSSCSDSDITISDVSLESLLDDDDEDGDEEEIISRRSPPSVATRTPRPRRKAAQKAQENWNALKEDLTDCEKDTDEVEAAPTAACRHARASAAAEQRLRSS